MSDIPDDASTAHPAFHRVLTGTDLGHCEVGQVVVDAYGIRWTCAGTRWVSVVESAPGLASSVLVDLCGPIRLVRPEATP